MGKIKQLSRIISDQIAAGEVIENPAGIIREILDNSIDAGAKNILIKVSYRSDDKESLSLLIQDDGEGMTAEDLRVAINRHATSKIRALEDIYETASLGFRGEGLASIASISHMTLCSKTEACEEAMSLTIEAGRITHQKKQAAKTGTCIEVSQIFQNVPVRKRFLKSPHTERVNIKNQVIRQMMCHETLNLRYITSCNNKETTEFYIRSQDSLKDKTSLFYGDGLRKELIPIDTARGGITIKGYLSSSSYRTKNRNNQLFIVKGRTVKNKTLIMAFNAAYMNILPVRSYAACFLRFSFPERFVDVNIHPTKADVEFADNNLVYKVVYSQVKHTLEAAITKQEKHDFKDSHEPLDSEFTTRAPNTSKDSYEKVVMPSQEAKPETRFVSAVEERPLFFSPGKAMSPTTEHKEKVHLKSFQESKDPLPTAEVHTGGGRVDLIGQLASSYILYSNGKDLFIMDQHAADERLNFDQLKERYKAGKKIEQQCLLTPIVIEKSEIEINGLLCQKSLFDKFGIQIEPVNKTALQVENIPSFFPEGKEEAFIHHLINHFLENKHLEMHQIFEKFISTVACRMSVMAGDTLSRAHMKHLVEHLYTQETIHHCPHGRPFIKKISHQEIERYFERR